MNNNTKKWVEALRSGKYKQGKAYLRKGDKYCCLGVACELAIESGVKVLVDKIDNNTHYYNNKTKKLPREVTDWLGLKTDIGEFDRTEQYVYNNSLTNLNDNGKTFNDIADIIESEPEGLFDK
jgi:hypothetical protein